MNNQSTVSIVYPSLYDIEQEPTDTETLEDLPQIYQESFQLINQLLPIPAAPKQAPLLPIKTRSTKRLTLVLDLDETLVHSTTQQIQNADLIIQVSLNRCIIPVFVKYRPYVFNFLQAVSQYFEIAVFTASLKSYADAVLNAMDPQRKLIKHRFYRQHCQHIQGNYIKDLRVLGRDLSEVIILDNSIHAFAYQLDNGIPITTWIGDPEDRELIQVIRVLERLMLSKDIRGNLRYEYNLNSYVKNYD